MDKFDLVQLIGNKTCAAANHLTQFVYGEQACAGSEVWNTGALVIVATLIVLVVLVIHQRRQDKLDV